MNEPEWRSLRPHFARHVLGEYQRRRWDKEGDPIPQKVRMKCDQCGATAEGECPTGQVRVMVYRFARLHLHRDPLEAPRVRNPRRPKPRTRKWVPGVGVVDDDGREAPDDR